MAHRPETASVRRSIRSSDLRSPLASSMRLVFMGTPDFAVPSLEILARNGYTPVAVVTGPDKPRGRGRRVSPTPVKAAAERLGIETILQPESVRDPRSEEHTSELQS